MGLGSQNQTGYIMQEFTSRRSVQKDVGQLDTRPPFLPIKGQIKKKGGLIWPMSGDFFWRPHPLASLFLLMQIWALYCYVHLRRCPLFSWGCNSGLWKPDTNASTEAALPWETHQVISNFWIMVHSSQSDITVFWIDRKWLFEHEIEVKILKHDFPKMRGDQRPFGTFPNYSSFLETPSIPQAGRKVLR